MSRCEPAVATSDPFLSCHLPHHHRSHPFKAWAQINLSISHFSKVFCHSNKKVNFHNYFKVPFYPACQPLRIIVSQVLFTYDAGSSACCFLSSNIQWTGPKMQLPRIQRPWLRESFMHKMPTIGWTWKLRPRDAIRGPKSQPGSAGAATWPKLCHQTL